MDTKFPLILTLSLGVGVLIFQFSGAGAVLDNTTDRSFESGEALVGASEDANIENDSAYGGNVRGDSDSDIVGVILGSVPRMLGLLAVPGILGGELQTLTPAPWWVAHPIGLFLNIFMYIGGFQVVAGRLYE